MAKEWNTPISKPSFADSQMKPDTRPSQTASTASMNPIPFPVRGVALGYGPFWRNEMSSEEYFEEIKMFIVYG